MKAYQVKIVLEGAKPPIWRRCLLPSLLDFRQLDELLKVLWGWQSGGKTCFFLPYQDVEVDTDEQIYEEPPPTWRFSFKRAWAPDVRLGDYFDEAEWLRYWFAYRTDNERTLKLTVEETVKVQGMNPPVVLKARGAAPAEGPGGLWQLPPASPAQADYLREAELAELNKAIAGIRLARRPANWRPEKEPQQSTSEAINELGKWLGIKSKYETIKSVMSGKGLEPPDIRRKFGSLRFLLSRYEEDFLKEIYDYYGWERQAGWNKRQLVRGLAERLEDQGLLRDWLLSITDDSFSSLQRALGQKGYVEQDDDDFEDLRGGGLLIRSIEREIFVSKELADAYEQAGRERDFYLHRQQRQWLMRCLETGSSFYGLMPMEPLLQMIHEEDTLKGADAAWVRREEKKIPPHLRYWHRLPKDRFLSIDLDLSMEDMLLKAQGELDFYPLSREEILALDVGPLVTGQGQEHLRQLEDFIKSFTMNDATRQERYFDTLHMIVQSYTEFAPLKKMLLELAADWKLSRKRESAFLDIAKALWPDMRLICLRGHSLSEVREMQKEGTLRAALQALAREVSGPGEVNGNIVPLRQILSSIPEKQMRQLAEQQGLAGPEGLKGRQLREAASRLMLRQERLDACLCMLPLWELQVLECIIAKGGTRLQEDSDECEILHGCGYMYERSDGVSIVPLEVKERYLELKGSEEYLHLHRRYEWLYECLKAASYLYILYPPRQLEKLLALEPALMPPQGTDLRDLASCLPPALLPVNLWADGQLTCCDPEEDLSLLEEIFACERKDFYLPPSAKEVRKGESCLLVDEEGQPLRQRLLKILGKVLRDKEACMLQFVCIITFVSQADFMDNELEELMSTFLPWQSFSRSNRKDILHLVTRLREHVRSPYLGGWSPAERSRKPEAAEGSGAGEKKSGTSVVELEAFRAKSRRRK